MRPTSRAVPPSNVSRSFSKISTHVEAGVGDRLQLRIRLPLIDTVAMEVCIAALLAPIRRRTSSYILSPRGDG